MTSELPVLDISMFEESSLLKPRFDESTLLNKDLIQFNDKDNISKLFSSYEKFADILDICFKKYINYKLESDQQLAGIFYILTDSAKLSILENDLNINKTNSKLYGGKKEKCGITVLDDDAEINIFKKYLESHEYVTTYNHCNPDTGKKYILSEAFANIDRAELLLCLQTQLPDYDISEIAKPAWGKFGAEGVLFIINHKTDGNIKKHLSCYPGFEETDELNKTSRSEGCFHVKKDDPKMLEYCINVNIQISEITYQMDGSDKIVPVNECYKCLFTGPDCEFLNHIITCLNTIFSKASQVILKQTVLETANDLVKYRCDIRKNTFVNIHDTLERMINDIINKKKINLEIQIDIEDLKSLSYVNSKASQLSTHDEITVTFTDENLLRKTQKDYDEKLGLLKLYCERFIRCCERNYSMVAQPVLTIICPLCLLYGHNKHTCMSNYVLNDDEFYDSKFLNEYKLVFTIYTQFIYFFKNKIKFKLEKTESTDPCKGNTENISGTKPSKHQMQQLIDYISGLKSSEMLSSELTKEFVKLYATSRKKNWENAISNILNTLDTNYTSGNDDGVIIEYNKQLISDIITTLNINIKFVKGDILCYDDFHTP
jgi:hypothetical protein